MIEEGYGKPVAVGLEAEARRIGHVFGGPVQRNLLWIFFQTEEVRKETGVPGDVRPRPVSRVGILGAGIMGGGIAPARGGQGHSRAHEGHRPEGARRRIRGGGRDLEERDGAEDA